MQLALLLALVIYGGARIFDTFRKRRTIAGRVVAAYTLYLLVAGHVTVFAASFYDATTKDLDDPNIPRLVAGVFLVAVATICRLYSVRVLGPYHSIQIEIRDYHPIISRGPYGFVRNPYYISSAVEVAAFPLIVDSTLGVALAIGLYWPCLYLRIAVEERALLEAVKTPFAEYMRRVPRFVPLLFPAGAIL